MEQTPSPDRAAPSWSVSIGEDEVLAILGHLLSSAELCMQEPELYGSFRLLDAASRLLSVLLSKEQARDDPFLGGLKREIDEKKVWMMYDRPGFRDFVRDVPVLLAGRLKERAAAGGE